MTMENIQEKLEQAIQNKRNRWIAIYIAFLAGVLAVCNMGGNNADKDAVSANIEAANAFAFFQAKNIRQTSINLAADELEILLATQPQIDGSARKLIEDKIKAYRAKAARYQSEPETGEGKVELLKKGKALELRRARALRQDPYFDYSQALLQIAIVLASVSILSGSTFLFSVSILIALAASALMLNGFTLWTSLPLLG